MHPTPHLKLEPVTRQNLSDSIVDSLRSAIFAGMFASGQRLAEAQLAGQLKVSRAPIREALSALEQEGLVHRLPGGGATVSHLSLQDAEEICTLRSSLETLALKLAMQQGDPSLIAELRANLRETEQTTDPHRLAQLDLQFHEIILRASGNSRLLANWLTLRSQIQLIMVQRNLVDANSPHGTVKAHRATLAAIEVGDKAQALARIEEQIQAQHDWIVAGFAGAERVS